MDFFIENEYYQKASIIEVIGKDNFHKCIENKIIESNLNKKVCFRYVGFLSFGNNILFLLPKYYKNTKLPADTSNLVDLYLSILSKSKRDISWLFPWLPIEEEFPDEGSFSVFIELLEHFSNFGIFSNVESTLSTSFSDNVNWSKTIETKQALITNNSVFYPEAVSTKSVQNHIHIIAELQKQLTNLAFNTIGKFLNRYDKPDFEFKDILEEYSTDFLLSTVQRQLNNTFIDRDIILLKLIKKYLEHISQNTELEFSIYGSKSFYRVWEIVCQQVFRNEYTKHKDLIPFPTWEFKDEEFKSQSHLIPDILIEKENLFYILDAKYYLPKFYNTKVSKEPGTESITKQIMYELLLKRRISKKIMNAFIFPDIEKLNEQSILDSFNDNFVQGKVYYKGLDSMSVIQIWNIPPERLFQTYLLSKSISLPNND